MSSGRERLALYLNGQYAECEQHCTDADRQLRALCRLEQGNARGALEDTLALLGAADAALQPPHALAECAIVHVRAMIALGYQASISAEATLDIVLKSGCTSAVLVSELRRLVAQASALPQQQRQPQEQKQQQQQQEEEEVLLSALSPRQNVFKGIILVNKKQFREALAVFNHVLALYPDDLDALMGRGSAHLSLGEHKEAASDFSRALRLDSSDPQTWKRRAVALVQLKRYDEAVADLTKAAELNTLFRKDHDIFYQRGVVHCIQRDLDLAERDFRKAATLDVHDVRAWMSLARVYREQRLFKAAIDAALRATKLLRQDDAMGLSELAAVYMSAREYKHAEKTLVEALQIDAHHVESLVRLAWTRYELGVTTDVVFNSHADVRMARGLAFHCRGLVVQAQREYEAAAKAYPKTPAIRPSRMMRLVQLLSPCLDDRVEALDFDRLLSAAEKEAILRDPHGEAPDVSPPSLHRPLIIKEEASISHSSSSSLSSSSSSSSASRHVIRPSPRVLAFFTAIVPATVDARAEQGHVTFSPHNIRLMRLFALATAFAEQFLATVVRQYVESIPATATPVLVGTPDESSPSTSASGATPRSAQFRRRPSASSLGSPRDSTLPSHPKKQRSFFATGALSSTRGLWRTLTARAVAYLRVARPERPIFWVNEAAVQSSGSLVYAPLTTPHDSIQYQSVLRLFRTNLLRGTSLNAEEKAALSSLPDGASQTSIRRALHGASKSTMVRVRASRDVFLAGVVLRLSSDGLVSSVTCDASRTTAFGREMDAILRSLLRLGSPASGSGSTSAASGTDERNSPSTDGRVPQLLHINTTDSTDDVRTVVELALRFYFLLMQLRPLSFENHQVALAIIHAIARVFNLSLAFELPPSCSLCDEVLAHDSADSFADALVRNEWVATQPSATRDMLSGYSSSSDEEDEKKDTAASASHVRLGIDELFPTLQRLLETV